MATTTISPDFTQKFQPNGVGYISAGAISSANEAFCRWENLQNAAVEGGYSSINPNAIKKTAGTLGSYDGGATSIQQVVGTGSKASVTLDNVHVFAFGLNSLTYNPALNPRSRIEWCVEFVPSQSRIKFYEQGTNTSFVSYTFNTKDAATVISVEDTGSDIQVYEDGVSIYTFPGTTSTYAAGDTYYFDLALSTNNGRVQDAKLEGTYA